MFYREYDRRLTSPFNRNFFGDKLDRLTRARSIFSDLTAIDNREKIDPLGALGESFLKSSWGQFLLTPLRGINYAFDIATDPALIHARQCDRRGDVRSAEQHRRTLRDRYPPKDIF